MDCVIVDGPPVYTLRGREACLYQVYDQIKIGGLVILDDFRRRLRSKLSRTGCPSIPVVLQWRLSAKTTI